MPAEVEIKFCIDDISSLAGKLRSVGFRLITERTHEMNTLYDQPAKPLHSRGALLRIRQYGSNSTLTYKDKSVASERHKVRREVETSIANGPAMAEILACLGFAPTFIYEKFRSEWSDGKGHVVLDETPIGNFGEIEGPPEWIDATARALGISDQQYIKDSYTELFASWKKRNGSSAQHMTFNPIRRSS
ncbi:MAG TPA: class IV adenylate cyclase [Terriglobales bacterium]|nr:class IV adenylate cyclase [Terriglobales bacterium]